ncbi:hypothetical protein MTO96_025768 [Rhipicephalus appendiculatus]
MAVWWVLAPSPATATTARACRERKRRPGRLYAGRYGTLGLPSSLDKHAMAPWGDFGREETGGRPDFRALHARTAPFPERDLLRTSPKWGQSGGIPEKEPSERAADDRRRKSPAPSSQLLPSRIVHTHTPGIRKRCTRARPPPPPVSSEALSKQEHRGREGLLSKNA